MNVALHVWFLCDNMSPILSLPSVCNLQLKSSKRRRNRSVSLNKQKNPFSLMLSANRQCAMQDHTTYVEFSAISICTKVYQWKCLRLCLHLIVPFLGHQIHGSVHVHKVKIVNESLFSYWSDSCKKANPSQCPLQPT